MQLRRLLDAASETAALTDEYIVQYTLLSQSCASVVGGSFTARMTTRRKLLLRLMMLLQHSR